MRTLLIAALSLSALTPTRDAEACGDYRQERVMRLSTHFISPADATATERRRTFVLVGAATPSPKLAWRQLAPMSYDSTQIAIDMLRSNPVTFTLVGPSGTRIVSSKQHVFLSRSWDFDKTPVSAVDIGDSEGFSIAIEGLHASASWIELEDVKVNKSKAHAWITALGVTPYDADGIYVSRIKGTDLETVSTLPKDGMKMITFLKQGDRNLGRYEGNPMGAYTNNGVTKLVLAHGALVTTVRIAI